MRGPRGSREHEAPRPVSIRSVALLLVPIALFAWYASFCFDCTCDDAYISYRSARNLAHGDGPVFNPGERVEGYSNPLWMLLLSGSAVLGVEPPVAAKLLGLAFGAMTLALLAWMLDRHVAASRLEVVLGGAFVATSAGFVYYAISGLETPLTTFQILLLGHLLLVRRPLGAALVSASLIVARPEGILFVLPLALHLRLERVRSGAAVKMLSIPLGVLALLLAWRWLYYGSLLPAPFHAKIDTGGTATRFLRLHTRALVAYTVQGFAARECVLGLSVLGMVILFKPPFKPLMLSVLLIVFFIWFAGGDWMAFSRFWVPAIPLLVLFWLGAIAFLRRVLVRRPLRIALVAALVLLPVLFNAALTVHRLGELEANRNVNPAMHARTHVEVGKFLRDRGRPGDRVVVNEVGAIGYYSDLHVVDMLGLVSPDVVPLLGKHTRVEYAAHVLAGRPRFVLLNDRQAPGDTDYHPLHRALLDRMNRAGGYRMERVFPLNSFKRLELFVRE